MPAAAPVAEDERASTPIYSNKLTIQTSVSVTFLISPEWMKIFILW